MILCLLENIRKTFRMGDVEIEVLKGIHLQVKKNEFLAIMGTSGSGKTTLMNIIGCLDVPSSGKYLLAGKEVSRLSDDDLSVIRNEHIGFVFQNFYLLPYATVLENVLLPSLYIDKRRDNFEQKARELLRLVGLGERVKFKPPQLSGGEQQRVAIARALINEPDLILTDEPTGQLDSRTAAEIMDLIVRMHGSGKTVIVITHDPHIASYAQRTVRDRKSVV